ncbi:MAG: hypothetical protein DCC67_07915 [Planctomycetota bacterium]|nr:MAG: hypothetical protein DCC67_07915 [Planctomycetota bacterium]
MPPPRQPRRRDAPASVSAGILLYRRGVEGLRVLLAHPGGPYFINKDEGAWTIPKGLVEPGEDLQAAARREFAEELGWAAAGELRGLGEVTLRSGKRVVAYGLQTIESEKRLLESFAPGAFTIEWPPRSGRVVSFPEVDRVAFFSLDEARSKLNPAQAPLLDRLSALDD